MSETTKVLVDGQTLTIESVEAVAQALEFHRHLPMTQSSASR